MNRATIRLVIIVSAALVSDSAFAEDPELRDLDVSHWFCLSKPAGTATKPDERERNLMKNRDPARALPPKLERLDVASFVKKVAAYDATLKATRRADLDQSRKEQLRDFENQIVSVTGWLNLAYSSKAESANCGDATFHDWHLEIFTQPQDHPRALIMRPRSFAKSPRAPKNHFTTKACAFSLWLGSYGF